MKLWNRISVRLKMFRTASARKRDEQNRHGQFKSPKVGVTLMTSLIASDATAVVSSKFDANKHTPAVDAVARKNPLIAVAYVAVAAGNDT
jgi:hypothetical protein